MPHGLVDRATCGPRSRRAIDQIMSEHNQQIEAFSANLVAQCCCCCLCWPSYGISNGCRMSLACKTPLRDPSLVTLLTASLPQLSLAVFLEPDVRRLDLREQETAVDDHYHPVDLRYATSDAGNRFCLWTLDSGASSDSGAHVACGRGGPSNAARVSECLRGKAAPAVPSATCVLPAGQRTRRLVPMADCSYGGPTKVLSGPLGAARPTG